MSGVPEDVRRLAAEREDARARREFAAADALRDRILDAGYVVTDTTEGPRLDPAAPRAKPPAARLRPGDVPSLLERPAEFDATAHWLVQGWPEDVERGIESFARHCGDRSVQHVVVDVTGEDRDWPGECDVVSLVAGTGWGDARNAGLVRSLGEVVLIVDGSVEADGDAVGPIADALEDATVGVTGPFGIVTEDLHDFEESSGPDVDAIEGYLLAFRRADSTERGPLDERFRFYRNLDIWWSLVLRDEGEATQPRRAVSVEVPAIRHEHRGWASLPDDERDRQSKRNFYRIIDRFGSRRDLLIRGAAPATRRP